MYYKQCFTKYFIYLREVTVLHYSYCEKKEFPPFQWKKMILFY